MRAPRVYISAGERSGDAHAGAVVHELRALVPSARIEGMGGRAMRHAGVEIECSADRASVLGLVEVMGRLPSHWRRLRTLSDRFRAGRYDLVVLVDYPGFHLRLASLAHAAGVPVLYYIAPQLWAWGSHRVSTLRRTISQLAVILPFEQQFFHERGVRATFVGHPLLDQPAGPARAAARTSLGLPPTAPILSLFPGSRSQEIRRLWPLFRDAARHVRAVQPEVGVTVSRIEGFSYPGGEGFHFHHGDSATLFAATDTALCKSGTTTLEAAIHGVPTVIAYRLHPLSYAAARRLVHVHHIGLTNLLAGRTISPELIQRDATPEALAAELIPLLDRGGAPARLQRRGLEKVRESLGTPGAAKRVANLAVSLLS